MNGYLDLNLVLSGSSLVFTIYFWFVKARRERPCLEFYQLSDFRVNCRRVPDSPGMKRIYIQQLDTGGVLIVNHSTRQNSVVLFNCFLETDQGEIQGDWGYGGDDKPPWNVGPESTIAFSPACIFDVPESLEIPEQPGFRIEFLTASGQQFSRQFTKLAPRLRVVSRAAKRAA